MGVKVKALDWACERKHGISMKVARPLGLVYELCVKAYSPGWVATVGGLEVIYDGDDEDDAKAAVQSDFDRRILSTLEQD